MKYYVQTFGCQMNKADSDKISQAIEKIGYLPALNINQADLVIVNMCSVRQSAVDRVFGVHDKLLKMNKSPISVLTGCILKRDKQKFEKIFDYVLDIKNLTNWPKILKIRPKKALGKKPPEISANVAFLTGCKKYCSYCVVPYVRGKEISRPAKEISFEIKNLIKNGTKEIWLLGQNVNSYKDRRIDFPKLLKMINSIDGYFWIRFTSSHPKDFSNKLADAITKLEKVTPYLNLPAQSGDNNILKSMNRHYKIKNYEGIIKNLRKKIPDISLSTDIIVGFPGETKKQFKNTERLFKSERFDMAYINKYSTRAGTVASKLKDDVPINEKKRREAILTKILKKTALEKNKKFINKITKALIESSD
ncbi:MAG: MiaB/RimO family radical SAM methylthiotransferase, partial [Candidatus Nealsonbacteria bacterium]|nr:MiaB/RimO family radical SAM methylthiotransferase [Candidatus Nealsonbacteria bacterium]